MTPNPAPSKSSHASASAVRTAPDSPASAAAPRSERHRVLLVDDQPIIGEAIRRIVTPHPEFDFEFCRDPLKAIETAIRFEPTVILQDLVMPGVDGLDLVRDYRATAATRNVPLVVLSSKEEPETKAEAFARGANDYLVKLPDALEVLARLRYHSRGYIAQLERAAAFEALAESRAQLLEEVRRAAEYVQSLLPEPLEGEVSTRWRFIPSAALGGDCFGHHWMDERRLAFYLLDVCGHGVGPALLAVSAMNMLRNGSMPGADPREPASVLAGLNEVFQMTRHNGMFFTLFYGVYDTASRSLAWSNAGHPPGLLVGPAGRPQRLESQGLMIGAVEGMQWETQRTPIDPGSRLVLYSDGLYELRLPDGSIWTLDAFIEIAAEATRRDDLDAILAGSRRMQGHDDFLDDASLLEVVFG